MYFRGKTEDGNNLHSWCSGIWYLNFFEIYIICIAFYCSVDFEQNEK